MAAKRRTGIGGRVVILLILATIAVGPLTVYIYLNARPHETQSVRMTGTLVLDQAGGGGVGSGSASRYDASMLVRDGSGTLNLTLIAPGTDVLSQHVLAVTGLRANDTAVSMLVEGKPVVMVLQSDLSNSSQFGGSFVALKGRAGSVGVVSPAVFGGTSSEGFVELRMAPVPSPKPGFLYADSPRSS